MNAPALFLEKPLRKLGVKFVWGAAILSLANFGITSVAFTLQGIPLSELIYTTLHPSYKGPDFAIFLYPLSVFVGLLLSRNLFNASLRASTISPVTSDRILARTFGGLYPVLFGIALVVVHTVRIFYQFGFSAWTFIYHGINNVIGMFVMGNLLFFGLGITCQILLLANSVAMSDSEFVLKESKYVQLGNLAARSSAAWALVGAILLPTFPAVPSLSISLLVLVGYLLPPISLLVVSLFIIHQKMAKEKEKELTRLRSLVSKKREEFLGSLTNSKPVQPEVALELLTLSELSKTASSWKEWPINLPTFFTVSVSFAITVLSNLVLTKDSFGYLLSLLRS